MVHEVQEVENEHQEVDEAKREFITKFGKYAATAPLGMYLLMTPSASHAQASGTMCHMHGKFHWGKCHVIKYDAKGHRNQHCTIHVKASKIGKVKLDIYKGERVVIHTPGGNEIELSVGFIEKHLKGWPIYEILQEVGIIS